jgi:NTE family protein
VSILHLPRFGRAGAGTGAGAGSGGSGAPRTAFVLGGGGNLGAIQVGMLRAVIERGMLPDLVLGCSVGAINAAGVAADPTEAGMDYLRDIWLSLDRDVICPSGPLSRIKLLIPRATALQSNSGLRTLLDRCLPWATFEEWPRPFQVVATSLDTGAERWFSSGPVLEPILASTALPAIFPPVRIEGELLIDGAVVNNVPIARAARLGAQRIVVFHVGNFQRPRPLPKRPLDVLLQSFSIARNARFLREAADEQPEGVELAVLPGVDPGPLRYDDFRHSRRLVDLGYASTARWLDSALALAP